MQIKAKSEWVTHFECELPIVWCVSYRAVYIVVYWVKWYSTTFSQSVIGYPAYLQYSYYILVLDIFTNNEYHSLNPEFIAQRIAHGHICKFTHLRIITEEIQNWN